MTHYRSIIVSFALIFLSAGCQLPDPDDYKPAPPTQPSPPVQPPPLIIGFVVTDVVPDHGQPRGIELVDIHGGGFQEGAEVFFGSSKAFDTVVSSAFRITSQTPPHSAGRVTVRVVNPDGGEAALEEGYQYRADVVIDRVEPNTGPVKGGLPVEIHGRGLVETDVVLFDGRMALDVTVLSDDTILALVPEGVVGWANVHVVGESGVGRLNKGFQYVAPLEITGISPLTSPREGGGTLSLTGAGLLPTCKVFINGQQAQVISTSWTGKKLVVRIPPNDAGAVDVLIVCEHESITVSHGFAYIDGSTSTLSIEGLWPTQGPVSGGGEVILAVHGMNAEASDIRVFFGDVESKLVSVDAGQNLVAVTVPAGAPDTVVPVSVEVSGQGAAVLDSAYAYVVEMAIQVVTPNEGSADGGTTITIQGVGFSEDSAEVFVGALPATNVTVVDEHTIVATTGPGSPGSASIRVKRGAVKALLPHGFTYQAGETQIFVCEPPSGAIAGNTLVSIYGVGLPAQPTVSFGQQMDASIDDASSTRLLVRTPRAEEVGPVSVQIAWNTGQSTRLSQEYTYYDPRAEWGGVWGDPIDNSINITVRESTTGDPIESAVVVVGHNVPPTLKGYTDERGQVTLSALGLVGPIDISAAKEGSSAASVMAFDATNVTLSLESMVPSPPGRGGPGPEWHLGAVSGMVYGIGKYLTLPPGQCTDVLEPAAGFCTPCASDADCVELAPLCTTLPDQPSFCSQECASAEDCPDAFTCAGVVNAMPRCVPDRGERQVRCFVSSGALFGTPQLDDTAIIRVDEGEQAFTISNVRLGEVAIYCIGGLARKVAGKAKFIPYVMGIDRHVFITPGPDPESGDPPVVVRTDVMLDIPLQRSLNASIEPRPIDEKNGPNTADVQVWLELGSDGFIPLTKRTLEPDDRNIVLEHLPNALVGELYDASYVYHAAALTDMDDLLPTSEVLREQQESFDTGAYYRFDGTSWSEQSSGYDGDILAVHALPNGSALAVTASGGVLAAAQGNNWAQQAVASGPPLRAIAPDGLGGVLMVGDSGRILRWDGIGWETHDAGVGNDLRGVANTGEESAVAVGEYALLSWNGSDWSSIAFGPPKDLRAVCRAENNSLWAVGSHGVVIHREGPSGPWKTVTVPFYEPLNGVWCDHNGAVVAVGEGGHALVGQSLAGTFESMPLPVSQTMHAVWGRAPDDVYAVGDGATVLHFDGADWRIVQDGTMDVSLRSIHGGPGTQDTILTMGTHAIHLGPFVWIPDYQKPISFSPWKPMDIAYTLESGASPSLHAMRIYGATGTLSWSITAPGSPRAYTLPDFWAIEGLMVPLPGPKQMYSFLVDHPTFDINHFDVRAFRLRDWRGWAISTVGFDNP
jgi:hypothetical protein